MKKKTFHLLLLFLNEILGTFFFILAILTATTPHLSMQLGLPPAATIGLALMVSIFMFGTYTGAYFNPTKLFASFIFRKRPFLHDLYPYIIAQLRAGHRVLTRL